MSNTCHRCTSVIVLSAQSMLTRCSGCKNNFCINCDGLCPATAKFINKQHDDVSWNCSECRVNNSRSNISSKLDKIIIDIATLKTRSKSDDIPSNKISFANIVKSTLKEDRIEQINQVKDSNFRSRNHIIHGHKSR